MSSTYQITQDCISDASNALYNGDYLNPMAATQAFEMSAKIIYWRLQRRASKSSQLLFNRDYIEQVNKQNVLTKVSIIYVAANYILTRFHSDPFTIPL